MSHIARNHSARFYIWNFLAYTFLDNVAYKPHILAQTLSRVYNVYFSRSYSYFVCIRFVYSVVYNTAALLCIFVYIQQLAYIWVNKSTFIRFTMYVGECGATAFWIWSAVTVCARLVRWSLAQKCFLVLGAAILGGGWPVRNAPAWDNY